MHPGNQSRPAPDLLLEFFMRLRAIASEDPQLAAVLIDSLSKAGRNGMWP